MALAQKFVESGSTITKEDATIVDILVPSVPLTQTGNLLRAGAHIGGTWLLAKKKYTGNFFG